MRIIRRYLAQVSLANGLIAKYADRTLPFSYYTRDRLMSWEARIIATAKAVKAMRVIAPFDSAQGAMTLIALATAITGLNLI